MRYPFCFVAFVFLASAGFTCEEGPNPVESERLAESRGKWEALKQARGADYRYTSSQSSFTGHRYETTVEVRANQVVRRSYVLRGPNGEAADSWVEERGELGKRDNGEPPRTVEQVYDACASEVLTKSPADNQISLGLHADGVLETCVYVPKGCADDCDMGVRITSFEFFE